jgi:hypothetical protein
MAQNQNRVLNDESLFRASSEYFLLTKPQFKGTQSRVECRVLACADMGSEDPRWRAPVLLFVSFDNFSMVIQSTKRGLISTRMKLLWLKMV